MRHYNIPIFIPELACPFRCVYCNQYRISGNCRAPDHQEIQHTIIRYLSTIPAENSFVELAFFGGSFTGLPQAQQRAYLSLAAPWLEAGRIQGIRLSTRPDYISPENLVMLRQYGVTAIEMGAQSLDDDVLQRSGRGHSAADALRAAKLVRQMGFETGMQMMTGLPGDTDEKALDTAKQIIEAGAHTTRIYPTLVIADTPLAELYKRGEYKPQTEKHAIELCARLYPAFEKAGVKVLRIGLHPSEGLLEGSAFLAGPFHPAFGEKVLSRVWYDKFSAIPLTPGRKLEIRVSPSRLNIAVGHAGVNKKYFQAYYNKVDFIANKELQADEFRYHIY